MMGISEEMSIAEFEALPPRGYRSSPQREVAEAMVPGDVLKIDHGKIRHHSPKVCGWHPMLYQLGRARGFRFGVRHLRDGRVAVACFPKESA
jgi:hypothetical protein